MVAHQQQGGEANSDFIGFAGQSLGRLETILKIENMRKTSQGHREGWCIMIQFDNYDEMMVIIHNMIYDNFKGLLASRDEASQS